MKFLNVFHYRDSWYELPPEKKAELTQAQLTWNMEQMKAGKVKEMYLFGNGQGVMCIWEVASSEEAMRSSTDWPLQNYMTLDITPLIEMDVAMKVRQEMASARR